MPSKQIIRVELKEVGVRLSPEELRARGEQLAALEGKLSEHLLEAKMAKQELKQVENELEAEIYKLAGHIRAKEEPRHVEVEVRLTARHTVEEVRKDTGEVLLERSLRDDETQADLIPFKGDA